MTQSFRRIVTVNDENGRSRILLDEQTPHQIALLGDAGLRDFWRHVPGADMTATREEADMTVRLNPPKGGSVFRFFQVPPEGAAAQLSEEQRYDLFGKAFEAIGASGDLVDRTRHPGMHKTKTIDYIILLEGEVTLLLDDGEVDMKPFDVVVQRQTNHAWVNRGTETATLVAVLNDLGEG
ncbi:cupin domain-containing protein [Marinibaculum pumilum]|uniref:Cupin domain-containing protein n=1 Tax=Marinibaculum pumilum TaxID=1766165 RepID=A0ABV7KYP6_9PROT